MAVPDPGRWKVLEPLLDRALELSDDERASWMEEVRAYSPLLAADLSALLSGDVVADRRHFLSEPLHVSLSEPER
jgi:hypothetical protein